MMRTPRQNVFTLSTPRLLTIRLKGHTVGLPNIQIGNAVGVKVRRANARPPLPPPWTVEVPNFAI